ncbi:ParB/RepB/Spo0J family partition protein [Variovorax sp. DAIF25]|uniref:ParB/RepB/Spo0J family partition protein n=1 Tax=Variovorax sp. DAIF25 TaxID=3080983 RepID=UPI003D6B19DD
MTARATARTPADTTASTATVRAKVARAAASDGAATKTPRVERPKRAGDAIKARPSKAAPPQNPTHEKPVANESGAIAAAPARDIDVPLHQLVLDDANVRKVRSAGGVEELAALIDAQGLLHRLDVVALADGRFGVIAGGRRLLALHKLASDGRWSAARPVECRLYDSAQAVEISLAENSGREAMHPADEAEAFLARVEAGQSVAQIAVRFGVAPLTVERRLKLARLAPRFLAMYREGNIASDMLHALALTDNHKAQEAVWDGLPTYRRDAWTIRRLLTEGAATAESHLARFVGVETYEARGGKVRRDLFANDDTGRSGIYLEAPGLLRQLATEKLQAAAEEVRAEGWAWVEGLIDADRLALRAYGQQAPSERAPSDAEAGMLAALETERERLNAAYDQNEAKALQFEDDGDGNDAYEAEEVRLSGLLSDLDDRIDAARAALRVWTPEQLGRCGAMLRIDSDGTLAVHRGLLRRDPAHDAACGAGTEDGEGLVSRAGRGSESTEAAEAGKRRSVFSEKLMRDLTAHRTAALQAALTQDVDVALATLVHRMVETVFDLYDRGNDIVKVTVRPTGDLALAEHASDYIHTPAAALLERAASDWGERLPRDPAVTFRWLLAQERQTLLELLAYCTARSIDAIQGRERRRNQSDAIAEALGLDMADWWTPSAANYLHSVSKAKAVEAVREASGIDCTKEVAAMKKSEAADYCAAKLEGTRWLPVPLRPLVAGPSQACADAQAEQEKNDGAEEALNRAGPDGDPVSDAGRDQPDQEA